MLSIQRRVISALIYPADPARAVRGADRADGVLHHPEVQRVPGRLRHRPAADHAGAVRRRRLFCKDHWEIILAALAAAVAGLAWWSRTAQGVLALDRLKLQVPLVGTVVQQLRAEPLHPHAGHAAGRRHPAGHLAGAGGARRGQRGLREGAARAWRARSARASRCGSRWTRPDADLRHHGPDGQGRRVDRRAGRDAGERVGLHRRGDRHPADPAGLADRAADAGLHGGRRGGDAAVGLPAADPGLRPGAGVGRGRRRAHGRRVEAQERAAERVGGARQRRGSALRGAAGAARGRSAWAWSTSTWSTSRSTPSCSARSPST